MPKMELTENLHGIGRIGDVVEVTSDQLKAIGEQSFKKPSAKALEAAGGEAKDTQEKGAENRAINSPKK